MEIRKIPRLILRPWALTDAEAVYEQARNPKIGAMCGWPPHAGAAEGRETIGHVLHKPHSFAICPEDNKTMDSISLLSQNGSNLPMSDREAGIGYWLGEDLQGKSYVIEAVQSVVTYAFEELSLAWLWGGTYQENTSSQRVLERCGLYPRRTGEHFFPKPTGRTHKAVVYALEKAQRLAVVLIFRPSEGRTRTVSGVCFHCRQVGRSCLIYGSYPLSNTLSECVR